MEPSKRYSFVSLFFILKCLLVMLNFFLVDIVVISYSDALRSSKYNYNISFSRSYIFCTINCNKFACLIESISLSGITVNKKNSLQRRSYIGSLHLLIVIQNHLSLLGAGMFWERSRKHLEISLSQNNRKFYPPKATHMLMT